MSKYPNWNKPKTIVEQMASIRTVYPHFEVQYSRESLLAKGKIQPTSRSCNYTIVIEYKYRCQPTIKVIEPQLMRNFNNEKIPHTYLGEFLCLYRPKYNEFKWSDFISATIIPWTSLWLYYYEIWHVTGEWEGGGEHPN